MAALLSQTCQYVRYKPTLVYPGKFRTQFFSFLTLQLDVSETFKMRGPKMNIIKFVCKIEYQMEVIAGFFSNVRVLED